ncbi:MAG: hypothetical protein KTR32_15830 [Granulosicoccus sp.]|nr:hypothetical protein [Granulosicoccus sp.]
MLRKFIKNIWQLYTTKANIRRDSFRVALPLLLFISSGCAVPIAPKPWSYQHPPVLGSKVAIPDGGVWCTSLASAKFMATTGWFAPDCSDNVIDKVNIFVDKILPYSNNGVAMLIIHATVNESSYWIPLPDHNWI